MPTPTSATTELQAINMMLGSIGVSPINSLSVSGRQDVTMAKNKLGNVVREFQSNGWHFNTEKDYPLARNSDNHIIVPSNAIEIDENVRWSTYDLVIRGNRMYNRKDHTYVFTEDLTFDITWLLPFEDMPQPARHYCAVRAARQFQTEMIGSGELDGLSEDDESSAWALFLLGEAERADLNILSGSYSVANVLSRNDDVVW